MIQAYAALAADKPLEPFSYDPGPLAPDDVELDVAYCGICHSDLSMLKNEWGMSQYPLVAGHEVVGRIRARGANVHHLNVGDTVGLGWYSKSCHACGPCVAGDNNLCLHAGQTIVGRHGGFAKQVRCGADWAIPLPADVDAQSAGPLFCGGITVFGPMVEFDVRPTQRVGVVGVGGLGHLALQFLNKWGCEVTAFSSNPAKADEIRRFGAHHIVDSRQSEALEAVAGRFDFIIVTANVTLPWDKYIAALRPKGRLHFVGAVLEPVPVAAFSLIGGQKQISGSPLGNPATVRAMLEFCGRHKIAPQIELFPLSRVNDALAHLEAGKARYRIVLDAAK